MKRWAISAALLALLVTSSFGQGTRDSMVPEDMGESQEVEVTLHVDFLTISTLEELTQQATLIAVGTVEGVAGTRNLARDPWDPQKPHPSLEILGVDYRFRVEEILKGSTPSTILVTESKSAASKGRQHVLFEGFKEMPRGARYILFLRETHDGYGSWVGIAEPWRFALRGSKVSVESKWEAAHQKFAVNDRNAFIAQVRAHAGPR
ncbi:hypothetical protein J2Z79_001140 [Symbiobacterium terraclitae]|uniref:Secreted protein n=1 Tax=Symbiobacterium terraclitae TaxID=557451 RepID=A0ABS4JQG3_9FIRM|nr:hypothetical protein [Symbiobacterium terraclitae]MBP2017755.1 hypothetical protein [Symbiobacterium terraclitae]